MSQLLTPDVIDAIVEWLDLDLRRVSELSYAYNLGPHLLVELGVPGVTWLELRAFIEGGYFQDYNPTFQKKEVSVKPH